MKRFVALLFLLMPFLALTTDLDAEEYDPKSSIRIKTVEFCVDKPKGLGRFKVRENNEYKSEDSEAYIYVELNNCKPKKEDKFYSINLAMDIDIYYEDEVCIYSEEDAAVFENKTIGRKISSYLWTGIDISHLKKGEYKVEMTIWDRNADNSAFTLTRFKLI